MTTQDKPDGEKVYCDDCCKELIAGSPQAIKIDTSEVGMKLGIFYLCSPCAHSNDYQAERDRFDED